MKKAMQLLSNQIIIYTMTTRKSSSLKYFLFHIDSIFLRLSLLRLSLSRNRISHSCRYTDLPHARHACVVSDERRSHSLLFFTVTIIRDVHIFLEKIVGHDVSYNFSRHSVSLPYVSIAYPFNDLSLTNYRIDMRQSAF